MRDLATAAGHNTPHVDGSVVPGVELAFHLANLPSALENPSGFTWDFVVMQEFSTGPTTIGNVNAFLSDGQELLRRLRVKSPNAVGILYETWADASASDVYTWADSLGGPTGCQTQLLTNYTTLLYALREDPYHPGAARMAPVGEAFRALNFPEDLYSQYAEPAPDHHHPGLDGAYIVSLIMYATIYNATTVVGLPPRANDTTQPQLTGLTPAHAQALQQFVDDFLY